jgi:DNA polymerase-3 subunit epsilon
MNLNYNGRTEELPSDPDFVAIDFETANYDAASACAIGLAFVKNGEVVANPAWLIRPPSLYFEPDFIKIHGITVDDVKDRPEFIDLWPKLMPYLHKQIVIAHNAKFDINVLMRMLDYYCLPYPTFDFTCTKVLSQKVWPSWRRYNLAALAERHGITFNHHNAGEDARVCAAIALLAQRAKLVDNLGELNKLFNLSYGYLYSGGCYPIKETIPNTEAISFGSWDTAVHSKSDQLKRQQRGKEITDGEVDFETKTGKVNGYDVTLNSCTCHDFSRRHLPCKHMYNLYFSLANKAVGDN